MLSRLESLRAEFRSTLTAGQRSGVRILGWVSFVVLAGLTFTGAWQLFAHESDPSWFDHELGSSVRQPTSPSQGIAELHGIFGTASGAVALIGGAWFAYKVAYAIPWTAVLALGLVFVGSITGSLIRFNAVKLPGRTYEEAGSGYVQLFANDVEYVVTDRWDLGSTAIRLLTVCHVLTVPVLLVFAWFGITRAEATSLPSRSVQ